MRLKFSSIAWLALAASMSVSVVGCAGEPDEGEAGADALTAGGRGNDLASIADSATEKGDVDGIPFVPAAKGGHETGRPGPVQFVVIHDIEGSGRSGVETFRAASAKVSAHYVIDKFGVGVQMVREADTAYHSGSHFFNGTAIGIEHSGFAKSGDYTAAEYLASAKLVASIVSRYKIPIDRDHIFGHSQVPSTEDNTKACAPAATTCGGRNHHDDPGPRWDWKSYIDKVKAAAAELPQTSTPAGSSEKPSKPAPSTTAAPAPNDNGTEPNGTSSSNTDDSSTTSTGPSGTPCASDGACNPGADGSGLICVGGRCSPGCHSNAHCPGTTTCSSGQCR